MDLAALCHLVDGSADAGNLAGHIVLVINALTSGHLDGLGGSNQLILCKIGRAHV